MKHVIVKKNSCYTQCGILHTFVHIPGYYAVDLAEHCPQTNYDKKGSNRKSMIKYDKGTCNASGKLMRVSGHIATTIDIDDMSV